ncbi:hypothetical protein SK571_35470 [Lentzea sp. BCCO 10_0798]|uniref:Uncharacterized protein n=1 Tax=Lentzea kristufekii TaxID=3095430 RepID=A0ABU4U299_9PSEU|nr:hypothetical protein [Lentzea sp. BCCO 10_0798]MDX8054698.1 hypothetical protein [Lentzea sp. BCCO 10_0798]
MDPGPTPAEAGVHDTADAAQPVTTHLQHVYAELEVPDRASAASAGHQRGLIWWRDPARWRAATFRVTPLRTPPRRA